MVKSKGVLTIEDGDQLLLACPGSKNYQITSGDQSVYATCSDGCLTLDGTAVDNSSTSCYSSYADSAVKVTDTACGSGDNTGIIVELGYEVSFCYFQLRPLKLNSKLKPIRSNTCKIKALNKLRTLFLKNY